MALAVKARVGFLGFECAPHGADGSGVAAGRGFGEEVRIHDVDFVLSPASAAFRFSSVDPASTA